MSDEDLIKHVSTLFRGKSISEVKELLHDIRLYIEKVTNV